MVESSLELDDALVVEDLTIQYGDDAPAIDGVSLRVGRGETVAVVGESGSGKSTLISAILAMLPANGRITAGRVVVGAHDVAHLEGDAVSALRGQWVGLVPQDPIANFNPVAKVVSQSVDVDRAHSDRTRAEARRHVLDAYEEAGLADAHMTIPNKYPHELSGGMRQRALIATALLHNPTLVLADEPTSALDVITQQRVLDLFGRLTAEHGSSVLFITHDLELALERADRVIVMKGGRIVEESTGEQLRTAPRTAYTKAFLAASERFTHDPAGTDDHLQRPIVLQGSGLRKQFGRRSRLRLGRGYPTITALDGVDFALRAKSTLAVVGQSGSGKTTLSSIALGLLKPDAGELHWNGQSMLDPSRQRRAGFRSAVQPVFQDPHTSLDPSFTVERTLFESLGQAGVSGRTEKTRRARELLDQVALPSRVLQSLPHELSGGQKQRVAIARALSLSPQILVCDEPVSALDVIVQAQVIDLLKQIQQESDLSILLISHDLGVVSSIADDVIVLRDGVAVDAGTCRAVFAAPTSEYTKALLAAIPGRPRSLSPAVGA
ncbi:peptide/nickel transport system ATP-binding protein [Micromonospora pallida]|uniref:Peptide/nickel transport system ATP-binding protein n=1 Tax=Micromonospora pallida TaxID=145854 RepID=A0A1C6SFC2_9ACTN|nr:ABC transporter ATP-binding protein [Micromonospora pallida]SCL28186.1 peptide/nickel transport system ATP-binding protein [Micromonospora pallida]